MALKTSEIGAKARHVDPASEEFVKIPWVFLFVLLIFWVASLTPLRAGVSFALSPAPSLAVGSLLGFYLFSKKKTLLWIYTILTIVLVEQIYIVSSSFIDEVVILCMALYAISRKKNLSDEWVKICLFLFLAISGLSSLANGVEIEVYIAAMRSYLQYALVFISLSHMPLKDHEENRIYTLIVFSGLIFSLMALFNLGVGQIANIGRAEGGLSNPNALAAYLIFALSFLWIHFTDDKGFVWFSKMKFGVLGFFAFFAFAASGSRSNIIGLACGLLLVTFLKARDFRQKFRFIVLIVIVSCAGIYLTEGRIVDRFLQLKSSSYMDKESNVRSYYTEKGFEIFLDNPLIGVGPGRFGGSVATIFPSPVYQEYRVRSPKEWAGIAQADVFYPHLLAELGIFGSFIFFVLVGKTLLRWLLLVKSRRIRWTPKGAFLSASILAILIASIGGPYMELHITSFFFWLYLFFLEREVESLRQVNAVPRCAA